MIFFCHATDITILPSADKGQKFFRLYYQSLFLEHGNRRGVDERLRIGQYTIHIKDHCADRRGHGFRHIAPIPWSATLGFVPSSRQVLCLPAWIISQSFEKSICSNCRSGWQIPFFPCLSGRCSLSEHRLTRASS